MNTAKLEYIDGIYVARVLTNNYDCGIVKKCKTWGQVMDWLSLYHVTEIKHINMSKDTRKHIEKAIFGI